MGCGGNKGAHELTGESISVVIQTNGLGTAWIEDVAEKYTYETGIEVNVQFDALVNQGDVVAMFFGHDHVNSFIVEHEGIDLVNTPGAGFGSYGDDGRGVRIIDIKEGTIYKSSITGIIKSVMMYICFPLKMV